MMIYKPPFMAITKALYSALKTDGRMEWFDSSVPIEEIETYFKDRSEFEYGIFGTSSVDSRSNKDAIVWDGELALEIYSNYRGRKNIAIQLEALLNFLSGEGYALLHSELFLEGYELISLTIGAMTINMPIFGESGIWQSGNTTLTFCVQQITEQE
jgi:hypothetical protein